MTLQHYHDDGSTTLIVDSPLFDEPKIIRHTEYENWVIDNIIREAEQYRPLAPHEIAQTFGCPEVKAIIKEQVTDLKRKLEEVKEEKNKYNAEMQMNYSKRDEYEFRIESCDRYTERLLAEVADKELLLAFMGRGKKRKAAQDFALAVQRAKEVPIEHLIKIQRRQAQCLWHEDRDPSLHYYPKDNRVYCFVCNKGWDAIDVTQKLHDCDFKEAVRILTNQ